MKQQGSHWVDSEGQSVPKKYVPADVQQKEKVSQSIIARALKIHTSLLSFKEFLVEQFAKFPLPADQKVQTIYSFDRTVKVQIDKNVSMDDPNFRVYMATKDMPGPNDYTLVILDLNALSFENEPKIIASGKPIEENIEEGREEEEFTAFADQQHPEDEEEAPEDAQDQEGDDISEGTEEACPSPNDGQEPLHTQEPEQLPGAEGEQAGEEH